MALAFGSGTKDVIRVEADPRRLDAAAWDALLAAQPRSTPFMRHAYLAALHASGSATPRSGWTPRFVTLQHEGRLVGAVPAYLKTHSWGEYVFDWAWADAYRRHGLAYYPKLVAAVPFTPVPGSRLLAVDDARRRCLLDALVALCREEDASSAHLLFPDATETETIGDAGWMLRQGVQFHWERDAARPCADFDALLGSMRHDKRKKIRQERRRVADAGIGFRICEGAAIATELWDFFDHCYRLTYAAHGSSAYLTRDFFAEVARTMAPHWVMFVAERGDTPIAASLVAVDRERGAAYGRYWGCVEQVDCLHFEACYYRPLEWVIAQGLNRFEGGAQGEHKMARGLMPTPTRSGHWLADARFADAVDDFLRRERADLAGYVDELHEHSPFRAEPPAP